MTSLGMNQLPDTEVPGERTDIPCSSKSFQDMLASIDVFGLSKVRPSQTALPASEESRSASKGHTLTNYFTALNTDCRSESSDDETLHGPLNTHSRLPKFSVESDEPLVGPDESPKADAALAMVQDPAGPAGQLYQGEVEGGLKHGIGVLQFEIEGCDGVIVYRGNFYQNQKHGHGVQEWPDGRNYCGQFLNDNFHGEGTMTWPNGHRYEGHYANGKKEGQGVLSTPEGSKFIGEFHDGKRHGQFLYVKADGTTKKLHFEKDKLCQSANPCLQRQETPVLSECASSLKSSDASSSTKCSDKDIKRPRPTYSSPDKWRIVDPGGAVVRFSSSLKSQKVGTLRKNEELTVVEELGRRLKIVSPMEGWVSKNTEDGLKIMVRVD